MSVVHELIGYASVPIATAIGDAVDSLRGTSPAETVKKAAAKLCQDFGFADVLISTVQGNQWMPRYRHLCGIGESKSRAFHRFSVGLPVPFAMSRPETVVIHSGRGAVVSAGPEGPGYLVAPIMMNSAVKGIVHAQWCDPEGTTEGSRLDVLEAFAECLAVVYESAVLDTMVAQQRLEVDKLCATVDQLSERTIFDDASAQLRAVPDSRIGRENAPIAMTELTAREREVMSHLATGATNRDIARRLLISEGTVKSHLKRIAGKFNTTNRAAALAFYLDVYTDAGAARLNLSVS